MEFPTPIPLAQHLGFELLHLADGEAELSVALRPELGNAYGVAHGGLLMTLLDVTMAHAARGHHPPPDHAPSVVTLEMKTSFLRAAEGRLHAEGRVVHRTATLAFCEARVLDPHGQLCATASGTFKYLRALPARSGVRPLNRHDGQDAAAATPPPQTPA